MRKEDKVLLPPKRKFTLPEGFHVKRAPRKYCLYFSYPVVDEQHRPLGTMTDLVGIFDGDRWEEIEGFARQVSLGLTEKLKHNDLK